MNDFWDTEYTIPAGHGFVHFCPGHLLWLCFGMFLCLCLGMAFRKWGAVPRRICLRVLAGLLVMDELFKYYIALRGGVFQPSFLPLHLCSINIFVIAVDAIHPSEPLREVLYAVCLPGALFALVFPGWAYLPLANALCIHSFSAHILLLLYPLLVLLGGFRPNFRRFARTLPIIAGVVIAVYGVDLLLDTNFMFLRRAGEGNPLSWLEGFLGNPGYLIGIPLIAVCCWTVLYGLPWLIKLCQHKSRL